MSVSTRHKSPRLLNNNHISFPVKVPSNLIYQPEHTSCSASQLKHSPGAMQFVGI